MMSESRTKNLVELAEILLDENQSLSFSMQGYSMYPALQPGDKGVVEKWNPNDVKIGDILVFKQNNKLIAHRLIRVFYKNGIRYFVAKGDKNQFTDEPFVEEAIIGKITAYERKNKVVRMNNSTLRFLRFTALHFSQIAIWFYDLLFSLKKKINVVTSKFRSIKENIEVIAKHSGKIFSINAIIAVLQGIVPFIIIVCIKSLVDQLTKSTQDAHQQYYFILWLIITAFFFLLSGLLSEFNSYFSEKLTQSVTRRMYAKLHEKHSALDLSNYENPTKQDKIHRAVQEASFRPVKLLNELLMGIKSVASSLFLVGLFISIKWYLMAILIVAIIPGIFVRIKFSKAFYKLKESQSPKEREMYYYNRILTGFPFAKELKLFGFSSFFLKRFNTTQNTLFDEKIALRKSEMRMGIYAQIFAITLIFISLGCVSFLKIKGEISLGTVVLFFFAFQRGYSVLNEFFQSLTRILQDNTFLQDSIDFLKLPTRQTNLIPNKVDFSLVKEIRFENVSFRYESSKRNAIKMVNITIPVGKTVAFVGANGSGKTTLIKLLCGFYSPDAGSILFDGIDASLIGQDAICKNISAVFQDFALYNISAAENLGLGNTNVELDIEKAKKAAQAAGIDDVISKLPNGYATLLGNLFKDGEELSIGQWQKIAIARAFYRDSDLILMDEPSSALDAESEFQIIQSLKKLAHKKTAIIVSHRLTTVQGADLIYFFHEGEVLESGNHSELMAHKGKYFELFQTANKRLEAF